MRNEFVTMPEFSMDLVEAAQRAEGILGEMPLEMLIDVYVRYKQFWFICKKYPEEMICPTHDIDQMWHLHMLHPKSITMIVWGILEKSWTTMLVLEKCKRNMKY
ncbi:glycine-rich domain-containing protein-like [Bacillus shihchuchen]|uniref:Glycine-rich domain-containing protein-like n=1 Tax=Bacillus shihchuchen TaxID=3036942 RepID=A0ABT7KYI4_9BACI|nr:glycine-rich domain-containing protein-like [Bacillus shihchuchen]